MSTSITNQESNFHTGVTKKKNCISSYHPMEMRLVKFWLGFTSSRIPDQKKNMLFFSQEFQLEENWREVAGYAGWIRIEYPTKKCLITTSCT